MLEMGRKPDSLRVLLVAGDPFRCEVRITDSGTWGGIAPLLEFATETWQADLTSEQVALFDIDDAAVGVVSALADKSVHLTHNDLTLAAGKFEVN